MHISRPMQEAFMKEAIAEAKKAILASEVPVGAIIVMDGNIIASAHNEVENTNDATAHAEILAIKRAGHKLGTWRLDGAEMFVTLEPCTMCIGAIISARISKLYFGCYDAKFGAVGSRYNIADTLTGEYANESGLKVYPEVLKDESAELLREFFKDCRCK